MFLGRLKAIEPSSGGTEKYASDASLVASLYDGQWRREKCPKVSSKTFVLPERVCWKEVL
jgi:hypothetical protein